jgi:transcriptional regulator with XRE-family HTH domain
MTLKEQRESIGKTQIDMAMLCGVSLSTYRLWEYGLPPSDENRKKLEEVLKNAPRQTD